MSDEEPNHLKYTTMTCGDCEHCGKRVRCSGCPGGYRNICNSKAWADYVTRTGDDNHITAEMGACVLDFKPKAQQVIA